MTALVPNPANSPDSSLLAPAASRAEAYARAAKSEATRRAYTSDWRHFQECCASMGLNCLPATPETVGLYIAALAEKNRPATISRRMAAIAAAHKARVLESPASMRHGPVASVFHGIRRTHGVAQNAKAPVLVEDLRGMVRKLRPGIIGARDRALLLVGFAGAFRRSELVALDTEDLQFAGDGLLVTLRRSKTDQEGEGRKGWHSVRQQPGYLPGARTEGLVGDLGRRRRPCFPIRHTTREDRRAHVRLCRCAGRKAVSRRARTRIPRLFRPFAPGWACDFGRDRRRQ